MTQFNGRQEFLRMLQNYLDGKATPEEKQFLETHYSNLENEPDILDQFNDQSKEELGDQMELFLLDHIEKSRIQTIPLWRKVWFRSAAASLFILAFVGAGLFIFNQKKTEVAIKRPESPSDFAPGEDKAILTLADGSSITLDGKSNGHIADQGDIEINKSEDGQLVYGHSKKKAADIAQVPQINMVSTPAGGQYRIVLPDGSKVWLNAKSSLQFPTFFAGNERRVSISGECYFEIAKNKSKPFIVDVTGKQEVFVTGTHFNINSYRDESEIKTTLLEGSVNVRSLLNHENLTLKPGEQSAMAYAGSFHVKNVDLNEVVAWKNGLFQFQNTSLEMVMRQVARWYNVEVAYEKGIPQKMFSGKIHRDANASQILEILKFVGVNFRIEASEKEGTSGKIIVMP